MASTRRLRLRQTKSIYLKLIACDRHRCLVIRKRCLKQVTKSDVLYRFTEYANWWIANIEFQIQKLLIKLSNGIQKFAKTKKWMLTLPLFVWWNVNIRMARQLNYIKITTNDKKTHLRVLQFEINYALSTCFRFNL